MRVQLLFIDTEGFESTGKADSYDDRIFALSALMSQVGREEGARAATRALRQQQEEEVVLVRAAGKASCTAGGWTCTCTRPWCAHACACSPPPACLQILVYNLPESIRESDLEKLSFAVELSKAFYSTDSGAGAGGSGSSGEGGGAAGNGADALPVQPGNMVWLIQRDFLQASTAGCLFASGPVGIAHAAAAWQALARAAWLAYTRRGPAWPPLRPLDLLCTWTRP